MTDASGTFDSPIDSPIDVTGPTSSAAAGLKPAPVETPTAPAPTAGDGHDYAVDISALKASRGDPATWAAHLADMISHTTGTYIDPATFTPWFESISVEARHAEARSIAFEIANLPIGESIDGDAGALLLDLRNEMSLRARKRADLV